MKSETILELSNNKKTLIITIPSIALVIFGWFLPTYTNWLLTLPPPFKGGTLAEFISLFEGYYVSVIASGIGVSLGIFWSFMMLRERPKLIVSDEDVRLIVGNREEVINKKDISTVYIKRGRLVFLDFKGEKLYRERFKLNKNSTRDALKKYEYPWEN